MEIEKKWINCKLLEVDGEIGVEVQYRNSPHQFTIKQIVAMYLGKLRDTASVELRVPVTDIVISVPGYYSDSQRRAMLDACEIAQIKPLKLLNEITSCMYIILKTAALAFGITRTDLPLAESNEKFVVAFIDMGHSSLRVGIVKFVKGKLNVYLR